MKFDIPIVLFIFKRYKTVLQIIEQIRKVSPAKIYLIGDAGRDEEEQNRVLQSRIEIEKAIDWDCEIIRNYAEYNRGVYENIGKGAKWVFQFEKRAIFLEDDNLPEVSFFQYCRELLNKYESNERVLWINGTNYLYYYPFKDGADYTFTQHLLPCGWASWSRKFLQYYDGNLNGLNNGQLMRNFKKSYSNKALYNQQLHSILLTKRKLLTGRKVSWDFQMCFSIRANELFGIAPKYNLIKNIGADLDSTHGGTSLKKTMTSRFCEIESHPIEVPLKAPQQVKVDTEYEKAISKVILWPLKTRILYKIAACLKPLFGLDKYDSFSDIKSR